MRRSILVTAMVVVGLMVILAGISLRVPNAAAKSWGWSETDFNGAFASQWSGTIAFAADNPLSQLNGPYSLTGRLTSNGQGKAQAKIIENFNGHIVRQVSNALYRVSEDGTIILSFERNYPGIGPVTFEMEGILFDEGRQARMTVTGLTGAGLQDDNAGMTIVGTIVRQ